jgi:hypothetical protein
MTRGDAVRESAGLRATSIETPDVGYAKRA